MNHDRFNMMCNAIERHADNFNWGTFVIRPTATAATGRWWDEPARIDELTGDCGTVACFGGWAVAIATALGDIPPHPDFDSGADVADAAAEWLELTEEQADELFYAGGWFSTMPIGMLTTTAEAVAAARKWAGEQS